MVVTLIVLVAMTLAAIALVRSVDTTNVIVGNLAFKEATVNAADQAAQIATAWLENQNAGNGLWSTNAANGYTAFEQQPGPGVSWDSYWNNTIIPAGLAVCINKCVPDAAGNTVSYTINRLCKANGSPATVGVDCAYSPSSYILNSSQGSGTVVLNSVNLEYYRITIRAAGPRNTVSYAQSVVAL
jgi:type IV pilus assembly protein PilX